ncbi:MAG: hypothetical protein ABFQ95_00720 [Pseudomonadota bacterium]
MFRKNLMWLKYGVRIGKSLRFKIQLFSPFKVRKLAYPVIISCFFLLVGCGFQPLYSPEGAGSINEQLQAIRVDIIADRSGQQLRNYLLDTMTPKGKKCPSVYRLKVELSENIRRLGFRRDNTPRHSELTVTADIKLTKVVEGGTVLNETRKAVASYSLGPKAEFGSFSARTAQNDARKRALKILSEDIKLLLAGFLSSRAMAKQGNVGDEKTF